MRLVFDLVPDYPAIVQASRAIFGQNNTLRNYFPQQAVQDIRYRLTQRTRVDVVGAVRSFDTPARQIRRGGLIDIRGELPAISAMDTLTESDLIRARQLAGAPVADLLTGQIQESAANVALAVDNAFEILRGQAFSRGRIDIDNGEVVQSVDFGVPDDNRWVAGTYWDSEDSDPLADLQAWADQYLETTGTGAVPGLASTSRRVFYTLLRHPRIVALFQVNGTIPALITPDSLNNLLSSYGLPRFTQYDRQIDGQRATADNSITFLPDDGPIGSTFYGVTEQSIQLAQARVLNTADTAGLAVCTYVNDEPVFRSVGAHAIGLPVITRPDAVAFAEVLPASTPAPVTP